MTHILEFYRKFGKIITETTELAPRGLSFVGIFVKCSALAEAALLPCWISGTLYLNVDITLVFEVLGRPVMSGTCRHSRGLVEAAVRDGRE